MAEANRGGMTVFGSGETRRCAVTRAAAEVRKNWRNAEKATARLSQQVLARTPGPDWQGAADTGSTIAQRS